MSDEEERIRADLVERFGEAIVKDIEDSVPRNPYGCKDTMDGRHWCRTHDSRWRSLAPGCEAALEDASA